MVSVKQKIAGRLRISRSISCYKSGKVPIRVRYSIDTVPHSVVFQDRASDSHSSGQEGCHFIMILGERLRLLREGKKLSQGEVEQRTGLKRCYISRVENGHTVPAIETLEKLAHGLEVPLYQFFYDGEEPPKVLPSPKPEHGSEWGSSGREAVYFNKLRKLLPRIEQRDRNLLLQTLNKMTSLKRRRNDE